MSATHPVPRPKRYYSPLPEGDLALRSAQTQASAWSDRCSHHAHATSAPPTHVGLDDDMAGLAGGLRADDPLHGLDLSDEWRLVAVGVDGHLTLLQLERHGALDERGGSSLCPDGHGTPGASGAAGALHAGSKCEA